jgi:hypothetical protein
MEFNLEGPRGRYEAGQVERLTIEAWGEIFPVPGYEEGVPGIEVVIHHIDGGNNFTKKNDPSLGWQIAVFRLSR